MVAGMPGAILCGTSLRIALIGRESDHRLVYPATLGSLGDAAASLGLKLDVHFFSPVSLSPGYTTSTTSGRRVAVRFLDGRRQGTNPRGGRYACPRTAHAGVMHGNAEHDDRSRAPTSGCESAIPAEVAPDEALHSFVPFVDGRHRCGVFPFSFGLIPVISAKCTTTIATALTPTYCRRWIAAESASVRKRTISWRPSPSRNCRSGMVCRGTGTDVPPGCAPSAVRRLLRAALNAPA